MGISRLCDNSVFCPFEISCCAKFRSPVFLRLKFSLAAGKFYCYENPGAKRILLFTFYKCIFLCPRGFRSDFSCKERAKEHRGDQFAGTCELDGAGGRAAIRLPEDFPCIPFATNLMPLCGEAFFFDLFLLRTFYRYAARYSKYNMKSP